LTFSDLVRKQDRLRPLIVLSCSSAVGRRAVWTEIKTRIETLADDLGVVYLMGRVISVRAFQNVAAKDSARKRTMKRSM
uniref:AAA_8 domain-containing protein n=1 Tax=Rodentolepis nana TaxID=102285 RepID=A0A0R3TJA8_RODNA